MAAISISAAKSPENATPLLKKDAVNGAVDYQGRPASRSTSGGWRSASLIIGVEIAERFAYYGISSNLISYLTGPLGQSTAAAAANVNTWSGAGTLLPLLGAFVADSWLGRYHTIILASLLYILGLGLLTLSASLPSIGFLDCQKFDNVRACASSHLQVIAFFVSLYLVAIAQGGHKPCVQAFGADQFDGLDPKECKAKSSFFNWWHFGLCFGVVVTNLTLSYIQDNLNWSLGFGIPCISMILALMIFSLGTRTYRYNINRDDKSPFLRIGKVFAAAVKNWNAKCTVIRVDEEISGTLNCSSSEKLGFLDRAVLVHNSSKGLENTINANEVEEAKVVLRLVPIWLACLVYAIVFAQFSTFFTKQGATMDRAIFSGFKIPPASLQSFIGFSAGLSVPIYDRILVPFLRNLTGKSSGITPLLRIGVGMFLSILSMVIAALVEIKRLKVAQEYGLVDKPSATLPMSVWWLVPQYVITGLSEVFTIVGLQEFFYDQVPYELRSMGLSLYLSIFGVGSFLSSFLVSAIDRLTTHDGRDSWFSNNLNRGHLDYFYWVLAGLSAIQLCIYLYVSKSYVYNSANAT